MMNPSNNTPIREDYKACVAPYPIICPEIQSGSTYLFKTDSGVRYEVMFAKKRNSYLENIINFSVLNEEFEDEYSETNRGELYKVIATVTEIIRLYHDAHNYSQAYEFTGEYKAGNENRVTSIRTRLYERKAKQLLHPNWSMKLIGNKVIIRKNELQ